ncbi:hypothetical protein N656DRAFT_803121 [Canariomyces notabilis]|uniref:Tc1-like transposase DDE domain-containing protein n=1 Tax=Canariomyces notabilis TaxID=2074819 RepID=A0AAN6TM05_9PEZI|nr:hypothetical protein N656DRAFT_803121 [Canariomyces arenarius]
MIRDSAFKKNRYTANSYIAALEESLAPYYSPERFFLQDNAKIHVARKTTNWLERHRIWVQEHPPHSPNLNSIEHVWKKIKEILRRDFPGLHLLKKNEGVSMC